MIFVPSLLIIVETFDNVISPFRILTFNVKSWLSIIPLEGFPPFDVTNLNRLIGGALKFHTKIKDFQINGFRFTGNTLQ